MRKHVSPIIISLIIVVILNVICYYINKRPLNTLTNIMIPFSLFVILDKIINRVK